MRALALLALAVAFTGAGCAAQADPAPEAEPTITVPELEPVSADVPAAARVKLPTLAADSAERRARKLTVRVRNLTCAGVATGSGFALARDVLITNRHVLAGADQLEVSTWDGRTLPVTFAEVGVLGDLGIVIVDGTLPRSAPSARRCSRATASPSSATRSAAPSPSPKAP